ncbi:ribonuclease H-like domain-containing protein [Tanacetum coccineum]
MPSWQSLSIPKALRWLRLSPKKLKRNQRLGFALDSPHTTSTLGFISPKKHKMQNPLSAGSIVVSAGSASFLLGDWLDDTDEEPDKQELEAHYMYMAKIQEQPEHINDTYVVEKIDSNVIPDSTDMCDNEGKDDQNIEECDDERVVLANLIANLKLDTDENKRIQNTGTKVYAAGLQLLERLQLAKRIKMSLDRDKELVGEQENYGKIRMYCKPTRTPWSIKGGPRALVKISSSQVHKKRSRIGINQWYQSFSLRNFDLEDMEFESTNSNTTAKLPILKLGDRDVVIGLEAYLTNLRTYARSVGHNRMHGFEVSILAKYEGAKSTNREDKQERFVINANDTAGSPRIKEVYDWSDKQRTSSDEYGSNAIFQTSELLGSQITDKSKKGLGYSAVPPPHPLIYNIPKKLDLSYSGLDEFKEPEFKGYGSSDITKESECCCDKKSDESKENSDNPLVKEKVSKDTSSFVESSLNVDKETVFPVDKKGNSKKLEWAEANQRQATTRYTDLLTVDSQGHDWETIIAYLLVYKNVMVVHVNILEGGALEVEFLIRSMLWQEAFTINFKKHKYAVKDNLFMRPRRFSTILNTLDRLGKFDGKSDEGFFVGYSLSSKAFRVYNTRTKRVEENFHIGFLENKPMIEGNGPKWLFDIYSLTQSMNYVPVATGTIINESAGIQGELNAGTSEENNQDCIVMPIWKDASYFDSPTQDVDNGEPKSAADDQKQDGDC